MLGLKLIFSDTLKLLMNQVAVRVLTNNRNLEAMCMPFFCVAMTIVGSQVG